MHTLITYIRRYAKLDATQLSCLTSRSALTNILHKGGCIFRANTVCTYICMCLIFILCISCVHGALVVCSDYILGSFVVLFFDYKWLWVYSTWPHVGYTVSMDVGVWVFRHVCMYLYVCLCPSLCPWCGSVEWEGNSCQSYLPRPASSPAFFLMM